MPGVPSRRFPVLCRAAKAVHMTASEATEPSLRSRGHHRPRGSRGGPQASRDVHRVHGPERAAPPRLRDRRQLRRRGDGGALHAHRRDAAARRRLRGARRRSRHPRWPSTTSTRTSPRPRWCSPSSTPAASSAAAATRSPAGSTASGSRWSTPSPAGSRSRSTVAASATAWSSSTADSSKTRLHVIGEAPDGRTGTTVRFWPDSTIFDEVTFPGPDAARAVPDDGVPQRRARDPVP